jgi:ABC-type maltose transport system permease subunit
MVWKFNQSCHLDVIFSLAITTIAAYAFSRFRFKGRQTMLKSIMLSQCIPGASGHSGTFLMIDQLGEVLPSWFG